MLTKRLNSRETGSIPLESQRANAISVFSTNLGKKYRSLSPKVRTANETGQKQYKIDHKHSYIFPGSGHGRIVTVKLRYANYNS